MHKFFRKIIRFLSNNLFLDFSIRFFALIGSIYYLINFSFFQSTNDLTKFFFFSVVFLIIVLGYFSNKHLHEVEVENTYLGNIIQSAARFQAPDYKHKWWREVYDLSENGDVAFTRTIRIDYTKTPVYWYFLELRLIEGDTFKDYHKLNIDVRKAATKTKVDWVPIEVKPNIIGIAIFLNPTVDADNPYSELDITLLWRGAFSRLFQHPYTDPGGITILRDVELLQLEFIAPANYAFAHMDVSNTKADTHIEKDYLKDRSRLIYEKRDVKAATVINYTLRVMPKLLEENK